MATVLNMVAKQNASGANNSNKIENWDWVDATTEGKSKGGCLVFEDSRLSTDNFKSIYLVRKESAASDFTADEYVFFYQITPNPNGTLGYEWVRRWLGQDESTSVLLSTWYNETFSGISRLNNLEAGHAAQTTEYLSVADGKVVDWFMDTVEWSDTSVQSMFSRSEFECFVDWR